MSLGQGKESTVVPASDVQPASDGIRTQSRNIIINGLHPREGRNPVPFPPPDYHSQTIAYIPKSRRKSAFRLLRHSQKFSICSIPSPIECGSGCGSDFGESVGLAERRKRC